MSRPFRTAAPYYLRYRPAYPPDLIARLAEAAELDQGARVLDLGCGPGSLTTPLAAYAGEVVAVDVEPEMITELARIAPANVTAVAARAEDVDDSWGRFRLVTVGRAVHWFDASLVLANLAAVTSIVALCAEDIHESEAQSLAFALADDLIEEPPIERPGFRYVDILAASPFSNVETLSVQAERTWTQDDLIGYVYSTSYGSPERLGERRAEFERRIRERLKPSYDERVTFDAAVGRRP